MLDMAVQIFGEEIEKARKSLPERMKNLRKTNRGIRTVETLKDEALPNGRILSIEYAEDSPAGRKASALCCGDSPEKAPPRSVSIFGSALERLKPGPWPSRCSTNCRSSRWAA